MCIRILLFLLIYFFSKKTYCQETLLQDTYEQFSQRDDPSSEDDTYQQSLDYFIKNALDLNQAEGDDLEAFTFLTVLHISAFLRYREIAGKLVSVYELQAIPGWDLETIQKILPYIRVGPAFTLKEDLMKRFINGEYAVITRMVYNPETTEQSYPGGREQVFSRIQYRYANTLQWGFTGEKDSGEPWFGGRRRYGFDFYSGHLFFRKSGIVKAFALGDYVVNVGQGLIHWQSMAFRKGADILQIKRQAEVLRPYHSAGEVFFQRGVGITIGENKWSLTGFYSSRKMDGTVMYDSIEGGEQLLSWKKDGYHRSERELSLKNTWRLNTSGVCFRLGSASNIVSLNVLHYAMSANMQKPDLPYHLFSFEGRSFTNLSIDWGITKGNVHWFGEAAVHNLKGFAFLSGLLISLDSRMSFSFLWRKISPVYQSLFGNAFTESSGVSNENGIFAGISFKPSPKWKIEGYVDLYRFPWLRYQKDAPVAGTDFFVQCSHRFSKEFELLTRYRVESVNENEEDMFSHRQMAGYSVHKKQWRTQFQMKINKSLLLRSRAEMIWVYVSNPEPDRGFLAYTDLIYKPLMKPYSAGFRWQFFETDSYDARIYAYENDVLFRFSVPSFNGNGKRYYLNLQYDLNKKISFWLRWAHTTLRNNSIPPGNNHKTGLNIQIRFIF